MSAPYDTDIPASTQPNRSESNRGDVVEPYGSYPHPSRFTLFEAAASGDTAAVRAWVSAGADLGRVDSGGFTALHQAAAHGQLATLEVLLASGADVHRGSVHPGSCDGATSLQAAVCSGRPEAVRLLLRAGARVDGRDDAGYTPLHLAAELGVLSVVRELLLAGAEVEPVMGDVTPLDLARRGRHIEVMGLLRQVGAS